MVEQRNDHFDRVQTKPHFWVAVDEFCLLELGFCS